MVVAQILNPNKLDNHKPREDGSQLINISELIIDTIQGENFSGYPSVILRLQNCTQKCTFCDSKETWNKGNTYSVWELVEFFNKNNITKRLEEGHHLIITGGSPLLQQDAIIEFIDIFFELNKFRPFIEIENECVIMPTDDMLEIVNLWNNSPKLSTSGNEMDIRYKPDVIRKLSELEHSFFKFVITDEKDWEEIKTLYLDTELITKDKIVLMPEASSRKELQNKYEWLINLCCRESVKFSDRLHITIWDNRKGV